MNFFFFSSRRRHTRWPRDWSSDVCSSDLGRTVDFRNVLLVLTSNLGSQFLVDAALSEEEKKNRVKIGRASCRERVESSVEAVVSKKKGSKQNENRGGRGREQAVSAKGMRV